MPDPNHQQAPIVGRSAVRIRTFPARRGAVAVGSARATWVYVRHALCHPWNLVVLAGAAAVGVALLSVLAPLLVFAGVELFLLGVVVRLRTFRRYVDGRFDQIARKRASEERAELLAQMCEEHRRELTQLEAVVDRTRDTSKPHGVAAQAVIDECLGLLSSYVRLAIAYNVSRDCLAAVDRNRLDDESRKLETMLTSASAAARDLARRRLSIARKRIERWDRSREALEAIAQQLAMIGDLVRLTHEQLTAPPDTRRDTEQIENLMRVLDGSHADNEEVAELLRVDETIDPYTLDMGRAAGG